MTITMPDLDEVGCRCTEMTTTSAHRQPHRQQHQQHQQIQFNDQEQEQEQERGCCTECCCCCCCCQCHHGRGRPSTSTTEKNLKNGNQNQNRHSIATAATTIINMEEEEEAEAEENSDDNYDLEEEQDEEVQAATVSARDGDGGGGGGTCRRSHRSNIGRIFRGIFGTVGPTGISVALIWLGIWGLLDLYLFPTNIILSASLCIALSIPLVAVCEVLQIRNDENETKTKPKNHQQQVDGIILAILTTLAGVLFWRGVWYLWDNLVFVNNPPLQKSLALIIGPVVLLLNGTCQASVVGAPALFPPPPREQSQTNRETIEKKKTNATVDDDLGDIGCEEDSDIKIDDVESMSVELSTGILNS